MTLKITKNTQQLREKLTQVEKPSGIAGEAMLRANTVRDQANLLGYAPDNIIINGDMKIAQRGTSTTTADGFLADRFKTTNGTGGNITTTQESDGPHTKDGHFKYYTQLNVTQADTSLASTEWGGVFYIIEGNDWDWFNYGTANAETATLSFWHCHNVAGTYCVTLRNQGGGSNRNYVVEYTQDIADEWQKTVIVFPGDFSGTWTTGTGGALSILFTYANGSSYHADSVTETNKWFGGTYYHSTENQVNLMSAANNKFRLTGVQLVRGNHPDGLPFQFRHYSEELLRCQRYYQTYQFTAQTFVYIESATASHKWIHVPGWSKTNMRTTPTVTLPSVPSNSAINGFGTNYVSAMVAAGISEEALSIRVTTQTTGGTSYEVRHWDGLSGSKIQFNAEI